MKLNDEVWKEGLHLWTKHKQNLDDTYVGVGISYDKDTAFYLQDWLWTNRQEIFDVLKEHHETR